MKRFNNKLLIIVLIVLVAAFVLTKLFRSPALESNLSSDLFRTDTSKITEIKLYLPKKHENEITLASRHKRWMVTYESDTANAEYRPIQSVLTSLARLRPERMVSRKKEKWDDYQVGDTSAIKLIAFSGQDEVLNLQIGKETGTSTYVRQEGEDEIYSVEGLFRSAVDKGFNDWRDKSFLRIQPELVSKITFTYPADSGFVVEKKGKNWMIGSAKVDSVKIETYLNGLRSKDIASFADDFKASSGPDVTVTFEGASSSTVEGWKQSFYNWVLTSERQPDTYFSDEGAVMAKDLFVGRKHFIADPE